MSVVLAALVACPSCPAAQAARSLVLTEAFWMNAWFAVLPFVVCAVVVRTFVKHLDRGGADDST